MSYYFVRKNPPGQSSSDLKFCMHFSSPTYALHAPLISASCFHHWRVPIMNILLMPFLPTLLLLCPWDTSVSLIITECHETIGERNTHSWYSTGSITRLISREGRHRDATSSQQSRVSWSHCGVERRSASFIVTVLLKPFHAMHEVSRLEAAVILFWI
jgi:hypothetical protein